MAITDNCATSCDREMRSSSYFPCNSNRNVRLESVYTRTGNTTTPVTSYLTDQTGKLNYNGEVDTTNAGDRIRAVLLFSVVYNLC